MLKSLVALIEKNKNSDQALKMSAYMKDNYAFAGIPKPLLKELIKPFLKETVKSPLDWQLVFGLFDTDYREAQYIAIEYLIKHKKELKPSDINNLKKLVITKSWWDTVDAIDAFVGIVVSQEESLKKTMLEWSICDNMWLRRVAIDFQQEYKTETDKDLLEKIIVNNLNSKEFFINKAIGWSLREYGKVNPTWVLEFVEKNKEKMAPLSVREATKLILKEK